MNKNSYNDFLVLDEGLVDISSGKAAPAQSTKKKHLSNQRKKLINQINRITKTTRKKLLLFLLLSQRLSWHSV